MDRLISEQAVIKILDSLKANFTCYDSVTLDEVYSHVKAIQSADEDEWVKRSDVLRVIDKRVDERLSEPFKGMTNGEVIKTVFNTKMIDDRYLWESLKILICGEDDSWWNSPYEPQERSDKE